MAKKKAAASAPAVDLKALAAELGVPVKTGKVTAVRNQYFVTVGASKKALAVGEVIDPAMVKKLVGQNVSVVVSGRNIVAIAGLGFRPPIITCYIPAPDVINGIRQDLRATVLKGFVDRQIITPALQERLLAGQ